MHSFNKRPLFGVYWINFHQRLFVCYFFAPVAFYDTDADKL